jgi:hypothetical protein
MARLALLIGVSEYGQGFLPLPAAIADVEGMRQVLANPQLGHFDQVQTLLNPTQCELAETVETWTLQGKSGDVLLLFFSGYCMLDERPNLYLGTRTTYQMGDRLMRSSAVAAEFIQECLQHSQARQQLLILDGALPVGGLTGGLKSDRLMTGSLITNGQPGLIQTQLGSANRVILTPLANPHYTAAHKQLPYSLYTRYLIDGLATGAADTDNNGSVCLSEWHSHVCKEIQAIAPQVTPQVIGLDEHSQNWSIAQAQIDDPRRHYRQQVARYAVHGHISEVGRAILDTYRTRLRLPLESAAAIEDAVLYPYRSYQSRLQQYREAVATLEHDYILNPAFHNQLQTLQQTLGLRPEDIAPIQAELATKVAAYQREAAHLSHLNRLQQYGEVLAAIAHRGGTLDARTHTELQALQTLLALTDQDVASLHEKTWPVRPPQSPTRTNLQALQHYKDEVLRQLQQAFPLTDQARATLKHYQQQLELADEEVASLEQRAIAQHQAKYQQNLQRYEHRLRELVTLEFPLTDTARHDLRILQTALHLQDWDVRPIEAMILKPREADYISRQVEQQQQVEEARLRDIVLQDGEVSVASTNPLSNGSTSAAQAILEQPHPLKGFSEPSQLDYTHLQTLLQTQQWRLADEETLVLMLKATGRDREGWLDQQAIATLPCATLQTLDRLWHNYSQGRFGFTMQQRIYTQLDKHDGVTFGDRVGWWLSSIRMFAHYNTLTFSLQAPPGHFPALWFWRIPPLESVRAWGMGLGRTGCANDTWMLAAFMARLENCHLSE